MRKIISVLIILVFLAGSISVITTGKNIENNEKNCEFDQQTTYTNNGDSSCDFNLKEGKYTALPYLPLKTQEQIDKMIKNPQPTVAADDLPGSFSWKSFGGDWTTSAKDQESCGSCWAFGALGGLEAAINIAKGDPDFDVDLSEQYILSCLSSAGSCSGGWMSEAIEYIKSDSAGSAGNGINGCPRESCLTYEAVDWIPCDDKCDNWDYYTVPPEEDNMLFQVLDFGVTQITPSSQSDWNLLKSWVYTYGPIIVDIYASSGWQSFGWSHHSPTDVYEGTETGSWTNHAQVLCGWVDDASVHNGGYWILKNSWGTGFGYGGFLNVAYGCLMLGDRDVTWVTAPEWPEAEEPIDPTYPIYHVYAGWESDPGYPKLGDEIQFHDQSKGPVVLWNWDFDEDGIVDSTEKNPEWTYFEEGDYKVNLKIWASSGLNSELTKTVSVKEIWPPVAVSKPSYYGGKDNIVSFEGRFSYDVDGTITAYAWDFNGDGTIDSTEPYGEYTYPDQNGQHTAKLTVTDNEGAKNTINIPINIDKTKPPETFAKIGGIDQDEDQWFDDDVDVQIVATDWSGVSKLNYRVDNGDWIEKYCGGELEYSVDFMVRNHGVHTIEFYAKDKFGNVEQTKTAYAKIDEINPMISCDLSGDLHNGVYITPVKVTINTNDADSGIEVVKYKNLYGTWTDYTGPFTINQGGTYTIMMLTEDKASNYAEDMIQFTLEYGPTKPVIQGPSHGNVNTEYDFYFTSKDTNGDQVAYYVEWGDGSNSDWTNFVDSDTTVTIKHTYTEERAYTIRAKAKDTNGAESEWSEFKFSLTRSRTILGLQLLKQIINQFPLLQKLLSLQVI